MLKIRLKTFVMCVLVIGALGVQGQGCSDAGFCTISSFKPAANDSVESFSNLIKTGVFFGNADHSIAAFGNYIEYDRLINEKLAIEIKLTTLAQIGNDISVFGLSDVFLNGSYKVKENLKLILGAKVPLSLANKSQDGIALPMDYQASLGTFDFILGIGYKIKGFQLIAAIQQPLTQNNNLFLASDYGLDSELRSFQSTNLFKRSGDVLLRVSYPISLSDNFTFTLSVLPIYHLSNDKYTDEWNREREIIGSEGLTLNSNLYVDYEITKKSLLQFNVGFPLLVRDVRPDGLTRSSIATLDYKIKF